jgi:hypothetical protein
MEKELDPRRLAQIDRALPKIAKEFGVDTDPIRARILDLLPRFATCDQVSTMIASIREELRNGRSGKDA